MSKKAFLALFALVFCACSTQSTPEQTAYKQQMPSIVGGVMSADDERYFASFANACGPDNPAACLSAADLLYSKKYFEDAAIWYDKTCSGLQYIPACLRLADMYDKGVGVPKDQTIAKSIWKTACFSGDKPSCEKMK